MNIQISGVGKVIDQEKIHQQCLNDDPNERIRGLYQLEDNFSLLPDKQKAWEELHRLTNDEDWDVRHRAASSIGSAFPQVPEKQKAWEDLIRLTLDQDRDVRHKAADALGSAFAHVPDKQKAWGNLHRLTSDQDRDVRSGAVSALGSTFSQVPDKQKAWEDLIRLTLDKDEDVRYKAAGIIGSAFVHVPDKQKVWEDLHRLTDDQEIFVRIYAKHSLGKVSILQASQAKKEEDYKNELEKAIEFFEKAAQESPRRKNPSKFCLPFYRSFYTIVFKKQEAKEELDKYLTEAKDAVRDSKSRKLLFEAVENLASALKEVQNLEDMDLGALKGELNSYRKYCDRVEEIINNIEENAPFAIETMRIGSRILDRNLKELIEEIQKKAKIACKESKGTSTQEIACAVNREVQKWEIGSQEEMSWYVPNIVLVLKTKIPSTPENKKIIDIIESMMDEKDLCKQYRTLSAVIGLIPTVNVVPEKSVTEGFENLRKDISKIDEKLEEMIVSLKQGPRAELVISKGINIAGSGAQAVVTIPLKEIDYPELPMDLEKLKGKFLKVSELPGKLFDKVRGYLY